SHCYAYDEANGLAASTDGCRHYSYFGYNRGVQPSRLMTTPVAFDPANPAKIYLLSQAQYPKQFDGAFVTTNDGASYRKLNWPFLSPGMIVVDAKNGRHVVVGDLQGGRSSISVSFDGGTSWTRAAGVPATPFWYAATISPLNPNLVLATSVDAENDVFILRSTDGGRSFKRLKNVVNAPLLRGQAETNHDETGTTHAAAYVYSPVREIRFNQDVTRGTPDVALTTLRGAYLSRDDGSTWQRLDGGSIAHSFWGIRWNAGHLYLASDGQGILRSTTPLQTP
ncbi:MAG: hypothetical protein JO199_03235, partial [Candidatus Eremiobacteraeota bacterium]|nr:hypothetical protein [Candidatus Eremiobacteraeota bacterium]